MDEIKAKQQVVEKIKEAAKILVTVSDNPSVDALSAALGLTLLLDKQEKYATAIFSGETPPAIAFLEPEKTFDDTTDSLRDFIIALNKEKADHLRYKVDGDAVKIFITPYKTTITEKDLEFSQGDYNVELVIALGVDNQDNLDRALENHGQILHDAAIITITAGDQTSDLGGIDWHEGGASSLSEMVSGLAEALKDDKKKSLLDAPIATALLTGIVAQTDRFSNEHTTSKAMTVSATLMAAGADQQLIATELQNAHELEAQGHDDDHTDDQGGSASSDEEATIADDGTMTINQDKPSDSLSIKHDGETLADMDKRVLGDDKANEKIEEELEAVEEAQQEAEQQVQAPIVEAQANVPLDQPANGYAAENEAAEPAFGGTLNATTDQAEDDARREEESDQNKTILSHSYLGGDATQVPGQSPASSFPGAPSVAPGSVGINEVVASDDLHSSYAPEDSEVPSTESYAMGGERVIEPIAPAAPVQADPVAAPTLPPVNTEPTPAPQPTPADLGLPLPPPIPDFSQSFTPPPAIPLPPTAQPAILGDILSEPTPSFETTNAIPAAGTAYAPEAPQIPPAPGPTPDQAMEFEQTPPSPSDPGQFKIPGQA